MAEINVKFAKKKVVRPEDIKHELKEFTLSPYYAYSYDTYEALGNNKFPYIIKGNKKYYFKHPTGRKDRLITDDWIKAQYGDKEGNFIEGKSAYFVPVKTEAFEEEVVVVENKVTKSSAKSQEKKDTKAKT